MTDKKRPGAVVGNAIVWAAMMIATALLTEGAAHGSTLTMLFVIAWFATHTLITGKSATGAGCARKST